LFGSFEITSIRLYTRLSYVDYPACTTWLRLFLHEPNKNCDQSLNICGHFVCSVSGDCLLCWYWWHCWPSLLKLSFHKNWSLILQKVGGFFFCVFRLPLEISLTPKNNWNILKSGVKSTIIQAYLILPMKNYIYFRI
jgi:hypothetical protein